MSDAVDRLNEAMEELHLKRCGDLPSDSLETDAPLFLAVLKAGMEWRRGQWVTLSEATEWTLGPLPDALEDQVLSSASLVHWMLTAMQNKGELVHRLVDGTPGEWALPTEPIRDVVAEHLEMLRGAQ